MRAGLLVLLAAACAVAQPSVFIPNVGTVNGGMSNDGLVQLFLGIPYASAAVRWQVASPHAPLGNNFDATQYGPPCVQLNDTKTGLMGVEDCLFINVYVPVTADKQQGILPVMVWTYGGSFIEGTGSSYHYNATSYVAKNNVIVVTYNYRLGPFGFFGAPELLAEAPSTGVYGVDDARAAFTWVQSNIRYFGGDPTKVTAFGESAGGIITCLLAFSPMTKGLFRSAIIESGNCDFLSRPQQTVFGVANVFAKQLDCTDPLSRLACMRNKTIAQIMNASFAIGGGSPFSFTGTIAPWLPSIDNYLLTQNPLATLFSGTWSPIPIILGANHDSFALFMVGNFFETITTVAQAQPFIYAAVYQPVSELKALLGSYAASDAETTAAQNALYNYYMTTYASDPRTMLLRCLSDNTFLCGTRRMAQGFSQYSHDVYLYEFQHHPSLPPSPNWTGAYHFAEVEYVFGYPDFEKWTSEEQQLSTWMQQYWTGFTVSGSSPNSGRAMGNFPPVTWPNYNSVTDLTLGLNLSLSLISGNNKKACQMWDQIVFAPNAWPQKASPSNARASAPPPQPPPAPVSSSPSRASTVVIAVVISLAIVAGTALLVHLLNRRRNASYSDTGSSLQTSLLKQRLYES